MFIIKSLRFGDFLISNKYENIDATIKLTEEAVMQFEVDTERSSIKGVEFKSITLDKEEACQVYYGWRHQLAKDVFNKRHLLNGALALTTALPLPEIAGEKLYNKVSDTVKMLSLLKNKRLDTRTQAAINLISEGSPLTDFISEDMDTTLTSGVSERATEKALTLGPEMAQLALQGMLYYVNNDAMMSLGMIGGSHVYEAHAIFTNLSAVENIRLGYLHRAAE